MLQVATAVQARDHAWLIREARAELTARDQALIACMSRQQSRLSELEVQAIIAEYAAARVQLDARIARARADGASV